MNMKVAVCYRGHYIREDVNRELSRATIIHQCNFFDSYSNHQEYLLNYLTNYDVYFHSYNFSDDFDEKLVKTLNPKKYKFEKNHPSIWYSVLETDKLYDTKKYDFVINLRFDLKFHKKFPDWNIDFKKFNFAFKDHKAVWDDPEKRKTSDLLYCFDTRYSEMFQKSYKNPTTKHDKQGSTHFIYNGLVAEGVNELEINFIEDGWHTSWTETDECRSGFISINRNSAK